MFSQPLVAHPANLHVTSSPDHTWRTRLEGPSVTGQQWGWARKVSQGGTQKIIGGPQHQRGKEMLGKGHSPRRGWETPCVGASGPVSPAECHEWDRGRGQKGGPGPQRQPRLFPDGSGPFGWRETQWRPWAELRRKALAPRRKEGTCIGEVAPKENARHVSISPITRPRGL